MTDHSKQRSLTTYSIGKLLSLRTSDVNFYLLKLGFLNVDSEYPHELTEEGKKYGSYVTLKKKKVIKTKWHESVVSIIEKKSKETINIRKEMRLIVKRRFVYVLELENSCYYVGSASSLKRRLKDHFNKKSKIKWIIQNPIICVAHVQALQGSLFDSYDLEDKFALGLAKTFGVEHVRGGKLSGHPEKAPASWNIKINASVPISKNILKYWTNDELLQYIK